MSDRRTLRGPRSPYTHDRDAGTSERNPVPHKLCIPVRCPAVAIAAAVAVLLLAIVLAGCASTSGLGPVVATGASYTTAQVEDAAQATSLGDATRITREQAPAERQKALARLRGTGAAGVAVADLITKLFPADTAAVPVRVELAKVGGTDALNILEAAPGRDGTLTTRRLWILSYPDGQVLDSVSTR